MARRSAPAGSILWVGFAVLLAGCLSDDDVRPAAPDPAPEPPEEPGREEFESSPFDVSLAVEGSGVSFNGAWYDVASGSEVVFRAAAGATERPEDLSYRWNFGDGAWFDGEAVLEYVLITPRSFAVAVEVIDGPGDRGAGDRVEVVVLDPQPPVPETIVFTGNLTGAWVGAPAWGPILGYVPASNTHTFLVDEVWPSLKARLDFGATAIDLDYELVNPGGRVFGSYTYNEPTGLLFYAEEPEIWIDDAGALGELGEWRVNVLPAASVSGEYAVTIVLG